MGVFKDFIPEGEPTGAQGKGFVDFVPEPKPVYRKEVPETVAEKSEPKPQKKGK